MIATATLTFAIGAIVGFTAGALWAFLRPVTRPPGKEWVECPVCAGRGPYCRECGGTGCVEVRDQPPGYVACLACGGRGIAVVRGGEAPLEGCPECGGMGMVEDLR